MATETQQTADFAIGAGATVHIPCNPPLNTFRNISSGQKFLYNDAEVDLIGFNVVSGSVNPAEYDTVQAITAITASGAISASLTLQVSPDGTNWVDKTSYSGPISSAGLYKIETSDFGNFVRMKIVNGGAAAYSAKVALTYKGGVA